MLEKARVIDSIILSSFDTDFDPFEKLECSGKNSLLLKPEKKFNHNDEFILRDSVNISLQ